MDAAPDPAPVSALAVADALYAGDPAEFVAGRDALAKEARSRKDRPLAVALKALRRPTVGAWYVNLASRARLTALVEWQKLGRELRLAQAALDFKRVVALSPLRAELERRVLADLTAHLAALGIEASPAGLEEVRSTLRAALTDADAAAAVESGRLDKPLEYGSVGFDGFAVAADATPEPHEVPAPEPEPEPEPPAPEPAALALARERLVAATRATTEARTVRDDLAGQLADADDVLALAEQEQAAAQADVEVWQHRTVR